MLLAGRPEPNFFTKLKGGPSFNDTHIPVPVVHTTTMIAPSTPVQPITPSVPASVPVAVAGGIMGVQQLVAGMLWFQTAAKLCLTACSLSGSRLWSTFAEARSM